MLAKVIFWIVGCWLAVCTATPSLYGQATWQRKPTAEWGDTILLSLPDTMFGTTLTTNAPLIYQMVWATAVSDSCSTPKKTVSALPVTISDSLSRSAIRDTLIKAVFNNAQALTNEAEFQQDIQQLRNHDYPTFLFYIVLATLCLLIFVKSNFRKYFRSVYEVFVNTNVTKRFFEEYYYNTAGINALLYVNLVIALSMLSYGILHYFRFMPDGWQDKWVFGALIVVFSGIIILKHVFLNMLAKILPLRNSIYLHMYNNNSVNIILGLVLFPVACVLVFSVGVWVKVSLVFGIGIVVAIYLYKAYRNIILFRELWQAHKFHFFVYLCTFEIAPLLIIGEYISRRVAS